MLAMNPDHVAIGLRIRRLRELRGLSRQQIATALRVDLTAAAAWEAGKYLPREARRVGLAQLLNCDTGTLFAEEQVAVPGQTAALIDPLSEEAGVMRALIGSAGRAVKAFRLATPFASQPFVQEAFRRTLDQRLTAGTIAFARIEAFYGLPRLKQELSNILRYQGLSYEVRLAAANGGILPALGGFLFDERDVVLGGYWSENPPVNRHGLRLSGPPFDRFFTDYWQTIWDRAMPLNPGGAPDLGAIKAEALRLGLSEAEWPLFLAEAESLTLADGLPPLL